MRGEGLGSRGFGTRVRGGERREGGWRRRRRGNVVFAGMVVGTDVAFEGRVPAAAVAAAAAAAAAAVGRSLCR